MGYHFREGESFVRILELTPALRQRIEATIEHLVSLLDTYDGDENLEDDGSSEPWLGSTYNGGNTPLYKSGTHDREQEDEHDEDSGDNEPELGWTERMRQDNRHQFERPGFSSDGEMDLYA